MHMVFTGNPGTGKTTIARVVARMLKDMGLLSKGQLVEVSRKDLVASYEGQTDSKVEKVFKSALGGVLFIDEAYHRTNRNNLRLSSNFYCSFRKKRDCASTILCFSTIS